MFLDCALWLLMGDDPGMLLKIAGQEGFFKRGTLPQRQNNPGALIYRGQPRAKRGNRGFANFERAGDGWRALRNDLLAKREQGIKLNKGWKYLK